MEGAEMSAIFGLPEGKQVGGAEFQVRKLADFVTDGRFNRPISRRHVNAIKSKFNARAFRAIDAWEREDGKLVVLDGQHRIVAAREMGVPENVKCIPTMVHRGLTLEEAAELFVQLDFALLVRAYDQFKALLTARHADMVAIDRIVRRNGLVLARVAGDGAIGCVDAVMKVYALGEPKGAILDATLAALYRAWGELKQAYGASLVRGVAEYIHEHRDVDPDELGSALAYKAREPFSLLAWAATIAGTERLPRHTGVAKAIEVYVMKPQRRRRPRSA
jgi:hypothetical protein